MYENLFSGCVCLIFNYMLVCVQNVYLNKNVCMCFQRE